MTEEERKERRREYKRAYYLAHRGEILSQHKEYRLAHHEEVRLYNRQYREENRDKILSYKKEYYLKHHEEELSYKREYHKKNRDKLLPQKKEYDSNIRNKALDLYGHKCELCGSVDFLEFHHLNLDGVEERKVYSDKKLNKSLADGNKRSDLQLLCRSCHHRIHNDLRSSI